MTASMVAASFVAVPADEPAFVIPSGLLNPQTVSNTSGSSATALTFTVPDLVRQGERGNVPATSELLQSGEDPSQQDDFGIAAMHCAAKKGHEELAHLLIQWRADVNAQTRRCETPLHYACKYGHAGVVRLLLEHRADIAAESEDGRRPAQYAKEKNHIGIVEMICEHAGLRASM